MLAFTGHRPQTLGGYSVALERQLVAFARLLLTSLQDEHSDGPVPVISGMALGWDQAVAEACVDLGIPFIAALPCPDQDRLWPAASRERWARLCASASSTHVVSDAYSVSGMQLRNRWMADRAELVVALWHNTPGGTANCVRYARKLGKPVLIVWNQWRQFQTGQEITPFADSFAQFGPCQSMLPETPLPSRWRPCHMRARGDGTHSLCRRCAARYPNGAALGASL